MPWSREDLAARSGSGTWRRVLRQSRHRHSDLGGQLHPVRHEVVLQSENGMLGTGPFPSRGRKMPT